MTHVNIHDEVITTRLSDVLYVPGMSQDSKLISMGMLLKAGLRVYGDEETLTFINKFDDEVLEFQQKDDKEALFWLKATTTKPKYLMSMRTISKESYGLMHRRFAHASKEAIRRAQKNTNNFPQIHIPSEKHICTSCAEAKMTEYSFSDNLDCADTAFFRIHSDLKEFSTKSYHGYKYFISFIDDYSSFAWILLLKTKDQAFDAMKEFYQQVQVQYNTQIV